MGMKFNVRPSDCKFYVNKDKKTVICIYQNCENDFIDFINYNCKLEPFNNLWANKSFTDFRKKMKMPDRFVGYAKCGDNDVWDEDVGKIVAFSRMKDNLNRSFFKRANTFFNTVDKWLDETAELINEIGMKLEVNQNHRHAHIENLIGKE